MKPSLSAGVVFASLIAFNFRAHGLDTAVPASPQRVVIDSYHGIEVPDPYRWLEDPKAPEVEAWVSAQDARTRRYLDGLPLREPIYQQLFRQIAATSSAYSDLYAKGGRIFALYNQPPKQQPMIAVLTPALDARNPRIIVDPNVIDPKGTTAIDWFVPSPNGKLVAVSLSEDGSEDGTLHLFDAASGAQLPEQIARVQYPTAGGSLAWRADSNGFWYTRYPGAERPAADRHFYQQIYFHRLGEDPAKDAYVAGKDFPKLAEIQLDNRYDPHRVIVSVANGDGGEFCVLLDHAGRHRHENHRFRRPDRRRDLGSRSHAVPGLQEGSAARPTAQARAGRVGLSRAELIVPESDAVIQGGGEFGGEPVVMTPALTLRAGDYRRPIACRGLRPCRQTSGAFCRCRHRRGRRGRALGTAPPLFGRNLFAAPVLLRYDEATTQAPRRPSQNQPRDFERCRSAARVRPFQGRHAIPLNIVCRKGVDIERRHAAAPQRLRRLRRQPRAAIPRASKRLWLDGGGIFVIANLRGGGEFGEAVARAGRAHPQAKRIR